MDRSLCRGRARRRALLALVSRRMARSAQGIGRRRGEPDMSTVIDLSKASERKEVAVSESTALIQVIERAARDPDIDIDKMERLLAMQERIIARDAEARFNAAMTAAQAEMGRISADATNPETHSKYASYA